MCTLFKECERDKKIKMVPKVAALGDSFVGAGAYYLGPGRDVSNEAIGGIAGYMTGRGRNEAPDSRVRFTDVLNMETENAEEAFFLMQDTFTAYLDRHRSRAGKKLKDPVYSYSLSWALGEDPSEEMMKAAAHETMSVLGLNGHQAVLVSHNDKDYAHIHVIANRINPDRTATVKKKKDYLLLSLWAESYERKYGKIYCEERVTNNAMRKRGAIVKDWKSKSRDQIDKERRLAWRELNAAYSKIREGLSDILVDCDDDLGEAQRLRLEGLLETINAQAEQRSCAVTDVYASKFAEVYQLEAKLLDEARSDALNTLKGRLEFIFSHQQHLNVGAFVSLNDIPRDLYDTRAEVIYLVRNATREQRSVIGKTQKNLQVAAIVDVWNDRRQEIQDLVAIIRTERGKAQVSKKDRVGAGVINSHIALLVQSIWAQSDSGKSFVTALAEEGFRVEGGRYAWLIKRTSDGAFIDSVQRLLELPPLAVNSRLGFAFGDEPTSNIAFEAVSSGEPIVDIETAPVGHDLNDELSAFELTGATQAASLANYDGHDLRLRQKLEEQRREAEDRSRREKIVLKGIQRLVLENEARRSKLRQLEVQWSFDRSHLRVIAGKHTRIISRQRLHQEQAMELRRLEEALFAQRMVERFERLFDGVKSSHFVTMFKQAVDAAIKAYDQLKQAIDAHDEMREGSILQRARSLIETPHLRRLEKNCEAAFEVLQDAFRKLMSVFSALAEQLKAGIVEQSQRWKGQWRVLDTRYVDDVLKASDAQGGIVSFAGRYLQELGQKRFTFTAPSLLTAPSKSNVELRFQGEVLANIQATLFVLMEPVPDSFSKLDKAVDLLEADVVSAHREESTVNERRDNIRRYCQILLADDLLDEQRVNLSEKLECLMEEWSDADGQLNELIPASSLIEIQERLEEAHENLAHDAKLMAEWVREEEEQLQRLAEILREKADVLVAQDIRSGDIHIHDKAARELQNRILSTIDKFPRIEQTLGECLLTKVSDKVEDIQQQIKCEQTRQAFSQAVKQLRNAFHQPDMSGLVAADHVFLKALTDIRSMKYNWSEQTKSFYETNIIPALETIKRQNKSNISDDEPDFDTGPSCGM